MVAAAAWSLLARGGECWEGDDEEGSIPILRVPLISLFFIHHIYR
jgi:hypothetical protein